jgi:hypothetical protein
MSTYVSVELTHMECGSCGVQFAIPETMRAECERHHGREWYCPNGHSRIYTKTADVKLREARAALERERQRVRATHDLLAAEERSHAATRGHLTRQKKRVAAGVCPCCNRTFQQLSRHMKTKHPDYQEGNV